MKIVVRDLGKRYGSVAALDGVNLDLHRGMFGLLGPNGAGKTTLMRVLATLVSPTSGTVLVDDRDLSRTGVKDHLRDVLGYLPQELGLYPELTAREFLDYIGVLKGLPKKRRRRRVEELLELVNLVEKRDRRIKGFSGGMKRRVGIAQALLNDPELLIVDEPTAGLDPEERVRLRTLLANLSRDRTVILSTHIVEDIAQTCDRLAVLVSGKVRFQGPTRELVSLAEGHTWTSADLDGQGNGISVVGAVRDGSGITYRYVGGPLPGAEPTAPTLEDGYMLLMRQGERQPSATNLPPGA